MSLTLLCERDRDRRGGNCRAGDEQHDAEKTAATASRGAIAGLAPAGWVDRVAGKPVAELIPRGLAANARVSELGAAEELPIASLAFDHPANATNAARIARLNWSVASHSVMVFRLRYRTRCANPL